MSVMHPFPDHWQRHLPVIGAVAALLLLPVAVIGRGDEAAIASIVTVLVALIALAALLVQRERSVPRSGPRGGLFLALVLIWLLAYAASLGAVAWRGAAPVGTIIR
jgi:protein-S-isoprenylcysteine O-methyltransferase Ste14